MFFDAIFDFFSENKAGFLISIALLLLSFYFFNIFALFAILLVIVQAVIVSAFKKFDKNIMQLIVKTFIPLAVLYSVIIFFAFAFALALLIGIIIGFIILAFGIIINILLLNKFTNSTLHSTIITIASFLLAYFVFMAIFTLFVRFLGIESFLKLFGTEVTELGSSYP